MVTAPSILPRRDDHPAAQSAPHGTRRAVRNEGRLEEQHVSYRAVLARLLLVALSFASINSTLAAVVDSGRLNNHWYLYVSPVLVAALSFGLRGGLLAAAAAVVAVAAVNTRVQDLIWGREAQLQELAVQLTHLSAATAPATLWSALGSPERLVTTVIGIGQDALGFGIYTIQSLAGAVVLPLLGAVVGWQVDLARRQQIALLALARRDDLTGALSGSVWLEAVEHEVIRSRRGGERSFALLLADIDALRVINARLGRAAGDEALRHVVETIRTQVRAADRVGRLGGDEFGLLLLDVDSEAAVKVARRLLRALAAQPLRLEQGYAVELGLSIGVAGYPDHGANADMLLAAAEEALGRARGNGGRKVAVPGAAAVAVDTAAPTDDRVGPVITTVPRPRRRRSRTLGRFWDRLLTWRN